MDKKVKASFTFGILLVTVGIIGHYFKWNQAPVVIILGLVFESYAALLYIWKKLKG